ncbi:hypothetical protein KC19_11G021400 [Ceratodon purpureus]|uniref:Uncharacterized protein n=1 Tax=Ceratodon purpureus TaxID=3225 RepID=A0A8T0G9M6_CERPU|nr:hypothetical protein KC19_11G021400 [Ceratodon purpureus]
MAPTSFCKSSWACLPVPLLLAAVLVGSLAIGANAQTPLSFSLTVDNNLDSGPFANNADCTITSQQLLGGPAVTFSVPAQGSNTVTLQATRSLLSPSFRVTVYGKGPLGSCTFFFFNCGVGTTYTTSGNLLSRVASLTGYRIVIVGNCGTSNRPALRLDGYALGGTTPDTTTCAQLA